MSKVATALQKVLKAMSDGLITLNPDLIDIGSCETRTLAWTGNGWKRHTLAQKWDGHWIGCKTKKDIEVILAGWNAGDKAIPPIGSKTDRLSPSEGDIAWLEEKPRFLAEMWDEIVNTCKDALKSEPIGSVQERGL